MEFSPTVRQKIIERDEQNGVLGCRYHHSLLDNGNKGLHREMDSMLQDYMRELYPGWTPDSVTYHKWL